MNSFSIVLFELLCQFVGRDIAVVSVAFLPASIQYNLCGNGSYPEIIHQILIFFSGYVHENHIHSILILRTNGFHNKFHLSTGAASR